jgi:hypothetical protein
VTSQQEIEQTVASFALRVRATALRIGTADRLSGTEMRIFAENLMDACRKVAALPDEYMVDVQADNGAIVELLAGIDDAGTDVPDSPEGL